MESIHASRHIPQPDRLVAVSVRFHAESFTVFVTGKYNPATGKYEVPASYIDEATRHLGAGNGETFSIG